MKKVKSKDSKITNMYQYIVLGAGIILVLALFLPVFSTVGLEVFLDEKNIVGVEITTINRPLSFIWYYYFTPQDKVGDKELEVKLYNCSQGYGECLFHNHTLRGVEKGNYHINLNVLNSQSKGTYFLKIYLNQYEDSAKRQLAYHSEVINWD